MPKREDETWLNIQPKFSGDKKKKYPYPASMECPICRHISLYYSEDKELYRCMNEQCLAEGKTLADILERKTKISEQLRDTFEQINQMELDKHSKEEGQSNALDE